MVSIEDLNSISLTARLVADPILRETSASKLASFRVAFNSSEKVDGTWQDKGNFINVTLFGAMAEGFCRYASKGSQVAINGRLQQREWTDKDGNDRTVHEIVANRVNLIGSRKDEPKEAPKPKAAPADDTIPF